MQRRQQGFLSSLYFFILLSQHLKLERMHEAKFALFFSRVIQHCFIFHPLDSTASGDTGIEMKSNPGLVCNAEFAVTIKATDHKATSQECPYFQTQIHHSKC